MTGPQPQPQPQPTFLPSSKTLVCLEAGDSREREIKDGEEDGKAANTRHA
jgi:hypothetical protein